MPALKATTGMPASMAFFTAGPIAGGSGRVTAMASTLASIAFWIRVACFPESGSEAYWNLTLSLAAAASAPLRMMSQKVSPGAAWVTIWTVISGVFACPAFAPAAGASSCLPPVSLQAAAASSTSASSATRRGCLRSWIMRSTFLLGVPCEGPGPGRRPRAAPDVVVHPTSSQRDVGNPSSTAESRGMGQRVVTTLPRV
jgi:hypothetical protein